MTIDDILKGRSRREFFDLGCSQASRSSIDEKVVVLAKLNLYNLLDDAIKKHKAYYSSNNYVYVIDELPRTLLTYLNYIQLNKPFFYRIDVKTEEEIYNKLKEVLSEKFEDIFAIERYIEKHKKL